MLHRRISLLPERRPGPVPTTSGTFQDGNPVGKRRIFWTSSSIHQMTTLNTLGHARRRTSFTYEGSVATGVRLQQTGEPTIDADFFVATLRHFAGQTVKGGFKEDDPPRGGFGRWVAENSHNLNS